MRSALKTVMFCVVLSACSNSGNNSSTKSTGGSPGAPAMKIDEAELRSKTYTLKSDLNFANADVERYKNFEGTSMEYEAVSYYYAFVKQERISADKIPTTKSFCSVYVESSPGLDPAKIDFAASGKLLKGMIMTFSHNSDSGFSLQLQGEAFQSFFLKCKNVSNSEGALEHIGHLLSIQ